MKLLVSGAFGYLGGRLAKYFALDNQYRILLGSRSPRSAPPWFHQAEVLQTRWESPFALEQICENVDTVIHLAGMNAMECRVDPIGAVENNVVAMGRLLKGAIEKGVRRFIYLSSAHVYDSPLVGVINENSCPVNLHPYATSHRAAEDIVRAANQQGEIEGVVIRLSNAYGAPANKDANCWMLILNDLCCQAVKTKKMKLKSSGLQQSL